MTPKSRYNVVQTTDMLARYTRLEEKDVSDFVPRSDAVRIRTRSLENRGGGKGGRYEMKTGLDADTDVSFLILLRCCRVGLTLTVRHQQQRRVAGLPTYRIPCSRQPMLRKGLSGRLLVRVGNLLLVAVSIGPGHHPTTKGGAPSSTSF